MSSAAARADSGLMEGDPPDAKSPHRRRGTSADRCGSRRPRALTVYKLARACNNIVTPGTRLRARAAHAMRRVPQAPARVGTMATLSRRTEAQSSKRAAVQARVLEATEALLSEGASFADLGIERIATRAGISRTAFYFYFGDKRELLMRLTEEVNALLFEQADIWFSGDGDRRTSCGRADEHRRALRRARACCCARSSRSRPTTTRSRSSGARRRALRRRDARADRGGARGRPRARRAGARDRVRARWMTERTLYQDLVQDVDRRRGRPRRRADGDLAARRLRRRADRAARAAIAGRLPAGVLDAELPGLELVLDAPRSRPRSSSGSGARSCRRAGA